MDILELLAPPNFDGLRSATVTGFLTLGGLMVAVLGLFTTRIHDFMVRAEFLTSAADVQALFPAVEHTLPLRQMTGRARRAASVCFVTAFVELGLGSSAWHVAPTIGLLLALASLVYVARSVDGFLAAYLDWLGEFENVYREMVKNRAKQAGTKAG